MENHVHIVTHAWMPRYLLCAEMNDLRCVCVCMSLQCESMVAVERRLKELGIPYIQRCVEEGGIYVDQIFFHDPDGFMIEICNCDKLPVVPLAGQNFAMAACKRVASVKQ